MIWFVFGLLFATQLDGQITETWHTFDAAAAVGRAQVQFHSQLRSRFGESPLYHGRLGPILQVPLHGLNLIAGYYFQETSRPKEIEDSHRTFLGVDLPVRTGALAISTRALWERFFIPGKPNFSRYRQMVRFQKTMGKWMPQGYVEVFFDAHGASALRPSFSVRRELNRSTRFDVGYFYDLRRHDLGGGRHVIFTTVRFQLR